MVSVWDPHANPRLTGRAGWEMKTFSPKARTLAAGSPSSCPAHVPLSRLSDRLKARVSVTVSERGRIVKTK